MASEDLRRVMDVEDEIDRIFARELGQKDKIIATVKQELEAERRKAEAKDQELEAKDRELEVERQKAEAFLKELEELKKQLGKS